MSNFTLEDLYTNLSSFRETLKLYHFQCRTYAEHKATDDLVIDFDALYDVLLEILQGDLNRRINLINPISLNVQPLPDKSNMINYVNGLKQYLVSLTGLSVDFINIRDEIIVKLNKYLYLLSFA